MPLCLWDSLGTSGGSASGQPQKGRYPTPTTINEQFIMIAIKPTLQGILIYVTLMAYGTGLVSALIHRSKAAERIFVCGFGLAIAAFVYRWFDAGHVPLQNLFEVFLCLGILAWPVSWFCRRFLEVGGETVDMLIGAIVLFPAGFIFDAQPQQLPPALQSPLFVPHVAIYMLSYMLLAKATFWAIIQLTGRPSDEGLLSPEQAVYRLVCAGFPLLTGGLLLGSVWGQWAWGDWWGWDPKELWSLASWLLYMGYFHFRHMFGTRHARLNSLWVIAGMAAIFITLLWVNLSRLFPGLHSYAT
jgi:ABC-type transport system involved in cytochrome c biogenesis permease subunit